MLPWGSFLAILAATTIASVSARRGVALCQAHGDPHVTSYDGAPELNFQGQCTYVMTRDGCSEGIAQDSSTFECWADYWDRRKGVNDGGSLVGWVKSVTCMIGNTDIFFGQKTDAWDVRVDGVLVEAFPFSPAAGIDISTTDSEAYMVTDFGLTFLWDGKDRADWGLPKDFARETCGLCGSLDGNPANDRMLGPSYLGDDLEIGSITEDKNIFGESWLKFHDDDPFCIKPVESPDTCSGDILAMAEGKCAFFSDMADTNPFQNCLSHMPSGLADDMKEGCVFDVCQAGEEEACDQVESFVVYCRRELDLASKGWRNKFGCPKTCPANMHQESCASSCVKTCVDIDGTKCPLSAEECVEGCTCDDGFVWNGDACVPPTECGCPYANRIVQPGREFLIRSCAEHCSCPSAGSEMLCVPFACGENTHCGQDYRGKPICVCNEGLSGDPNTGCTGPPGEPIPPPARVTCALHGDPHINLFDGGNRVNFQGCCTYTLIADNWANGNYVGDSKFECWADFWNRGVGLNSRGFAASWVKSLTCQIGEDEIFFGQSPNGWDVRVNEVGMVAFPHSPSPGVEIGTTDHEVYMTTDFGLHILWDGFERAEINLPGDYSTPTAGLCGTLDLDYSNDWVVGPAYNQSDFSIGEIVANKRIFTGSWLRWLDDDPYCEFPKFGFNKAEEEDAEECAGDNLRAARKECKFFRFDAETDASPLRECFLAMPGRERIELKEGCIFDVCMSDPGEGCHQLESVVMRCLENYGILTRGWREFYECPAICEVNEHYEDCASFCLNTCADRDGSYCREYELGDSCAPGCTCDDGFIWDGDKCVNSSGCGCPWLDTVVPIGAAFEADNCGQFCSCPAAGGELQCGTLACNADDTPFADPGTLGAFVAGVDTYVPGKRSKKSGKSEKTGKTEKSGKSEKTGKTEKSSKSGKSRRKRSDENGSKSKSASKKNGSKSKSASKSKKSKKSKKDKVHGCCKNGKVQRKSERKEKKKKDKGSKKSKKEKSKKENKKSR